LSFARTLDRGEGLFEKYLAEAKAKNLKTVDGAFVWRLYDTYGFPTDLTRLMAQENAMNIDEQGFEEAQAKAKEVSKRRKEGKGGDEVLKLDIHARGLLEQDGSVPKTDDSPKYALDPIQAEVKAIFSLGASFSKTTEGIDDSEQVGVILDRTNFYAEQGGQEYDTGRITIDGQADFEVTNVQAYKGYVMHTGYLISGNLHVGDKVIATYDELRRWPIKNNHTGTHILNFGLREVLGDGVDQRGSLVAAEKLRFDFSHNAPCKDSELEQIEDICSDYIRNDVRVYSQDVPLDIAEKIRGVRKIFDEKYPTPVRVVSVGAPLNDILADLTNEKWIKYSIEFCGGTHVAKTGDIKDLVILTEESIAKGIRRIFAITGSDAQEACRLANDFDAKLRKVENLPFSPEKLTSAATLKTENDRDLKGVIPAVRRSNFAARIKTIEAEGAKMAKEKAKADEKKIVQTITEYFKGEGENAPGLVAVLPVTPDPKLLTTSIATAFRKGKLQKSVYLFAADNSKLVHVCYVPQVPTRLISLICRRIFRN
jgi:alanyl-tRNA synthetase